MKHLNYYECLFNWLEIREKHGLDFPSSMDQLKISMMKSALLSRILEGKEIYPIPPPQSYSYPWYDLIEYSEGYCTEVWEADDWTKAFYSYPTLYIDQFPWKIIKEVSSEEWIVTYAYEINNEEKFCEDTWRVLKSKENNCWLIKKNIP